MRDRGKLNKTPFRVKDQKRNVHGIEIVFPYIKEKKKSEIITIDEIIINVTSTMDKYLSFLHIAPPLAFLFERGRWKSTSYTFLLNTYPE